MNVQILMSTYNGEKYLRTQLDSILSQRYHSFSLLIRDDGSHDHTIAILEEYAKKDGRVSWFRGENLGAALSFFDLINKADVNAEYYAFADQDDLWMPDKLERAVQIIKNMETESFGDEKIISEILTSDNLRGDVPILYCGAKILVDEELHPLKNAVSIRVKKLSFGNALVQNICTGCTCAINKKLMILLQKYKPKNMIMHDWWFYLVASSMGQVVYDLRPEIYYRQHGNNTSGAMVSQKALIKYRISQLFEKRGEIIYQNKEFYEEYSDEISEENRRMLQKLIISKHSIFKRLQVINDSRFYRQKELDNWILKGIVFWGKL